jgi:pyruvate formate lyase activating enzyme
MYGEEKTAIEIMDIVEKDKNYYSKSGGGVTFTGGEPFYQFEFLMELLTEAKSRGLHTCIETSGFSNLKEFAKAASLTDIFLFDYKMSGNKNYKKYTGVPNDLILRNLEHLNKIEAKVILRCIIIPEINDNMKHFHSITRLTKQYPNIIETHILPYHDFARNKYEQLGMSYSLEQTSVQHEQAEKWLEQIRSTGCENVKLV